MSQTILGPGGANYLSPNMPVAAYKTYGLANPKSTHFRSGTCQEVECGAYQHGWTSVIDVSTDLGKRQANYILNGSGRKFTSTEAGTTVTFVFAPGQKCFTDHQVSLERDPIFYTFQGDWRARLSDVTRRSPDNWLEDFAEHQINLKDSIQRG